MLGSRWPLSEEVFLEHVGFGRKGGLRNKVANLCSSERERLCVADKHPIPDAEPFSLPLCCSQIHPGRCAHRDATVYNKVLGMAKSMEQFFCTRQPGSSGKVYEILADLRDLTLKLVFVAHKRNRRLHVQIRVVFARVGVSAEGQLFFRPRHLPDGSFENMFFNCVAHRPRIYWTWC